MFRTHCEYLRYVREKVCKMTLVFFSLFLFFVKLLYPCIHRYIYISPNNTHNSYIYFLFFVSNNYCAALGPLLDYEEK